MRWHRYFASLIETNVLKFMSSLYVILFYNLFVTIWCKDNKLIIYLSKDNKQIFYLSKKKKIQISKS
jgi:hypothetical protein